MGGKNPPLAAHPQKKEERACFSGGRKSKKCPDHLETSDKKNRELIRREEGQAP